jgi:hypothetical protein
MTKIALLCPSKGRPELYKRMVDSAASTGKAMRYVWLAVSEEDAPKYHQDWNRVIVPDGMPTVHKWNMLAQHAMRDPEVKMFMLAADDIIFQTHTWDRALIESYETLKNKIHCWHLLDSRDPEGTPHPVVSREWIEAMGYFVPPIFCHFYPDTWTVAIAKANNCFTHLKGYLLIHDKPSDRGEPDQTHRRIRENGIHARDKYVNDTCQHMLEDEKARLAKALGIGYKSWTMFTGASQK